MLRRETLVIKRMGFVKCKDGMTREACHDYWLNVHAPIVARTPGIRRYIVSTTTTEGLDYAPAYDGLVEIWFDDLASLQAAEATPEWQAVRDDARQFIGSVDTLFASEVPVIEDERSARNHASWLKYCGLLTRRPGMPVDRFQAHWRDVHGPLVVAEFTTMVRYSQSHALAETYGTSREPAYDGVPQAWFESVDTIPKAILGRTGEEKNTPAALDSEAIFVQPIPIIVTREHVIIE
jgi:uncharacterized protein (TIGR02118 family)